MKAIQAERQSVRRRYLAAIVLCFACGIPREQRELAAADAESFEAVVQSQMADSVGTGFLRVDARPAGDKEILAPTSPPSEGFDPDSSLSAASETDTKLFTDQRKEILHDLHVEEGGPFVYPDCGGLKTRRFRDSSQVHSDPKCPKSFRRYVTVGLPTRGAAAVISKARRPEAPPPDTTGELWTVLVTETSISPGGQQFQQYAWLFRRDDTTGRLGVSEKYLLSWAE